MNWNAIIIVSLLHYVTSSILISSPFDNFRIECPQGSGAQRLSVRMVESQGSKRQDTVFVLSCNKITEIYSWENIPQGVADIEREDCHYTSMFDPIMDTSMNYSCAPREYVSGISRVTDTRIQVMCCKMRSRDEANCETARFEKPFGFDGKVEIQLLGKLINRISIEKNFYQVRFCDLVPRNIDAILADVRTTSTRKPTTTTRTTTTPVTTTTRVITPVATTTQIPTTVLTTQETTTVGTTTTVQVPIPVEVKQELPVFDEPNLIAPSDITNISNDEAVSTVSQLSSSTNVTALPTVTLSTIIEDISNTVDEDLEETVLSPQHSENATHRASSVEVSPSPMPRENVFPTDKDYENMEETEFELMSTIAELMRVKTIAKNIINKVRASGVKQQMKQKQQEMAEQLLREIEDENDPDRADALFKQSIEMLNELSEAKAIMSTEEFSKEVLRQSSFEDNDFPEPHFSTKAIETSTRKAMLSSNRLTSNFLTPVQSKSKLVSLPLQQSEIGEDPFTSVESVFTNPSVSLTTTPLPTTKKILMPWPRWSQIEKSNENDVFELTSTHQSFSINPTMVTSVPILTPFTSELTSTRSYHPITKPTTSTTVEGLTYQDSQSTEVISDTPKPAVMKLVLKKKSKTRVFKPPVESQPEQEIIAAATSEDSRRAPPRHQKHLSSTLPPLDNFPSPPPSARHYQRVTNLKKFETRRRQKPSTFDFDEYEEAIRPSTSFTYSNRGKWGYGSKAAAANKALTSNQPYVDEETRQSPFEDSNEARILQKKLQATTTPQPEYDEESYETTQQTSRPHRYRGRISSDDFSPFEIRRSPLPRGPSSTHEFNKYATMKELPSNIGSAHFDLISKGNNEKEGKMFSSEDHVEISDGTKTFQPKDEAPMKMPAIAKIFKELSSFQDSFEPMESLVPMDEEQEEISTESTTMSTDAPTVASTTTEQTTVKATTSTLTTTTTFLAPTTTTTTATPTMATTTETPTTTTKEEVAIPVESVFPEEEVDQEETVVVETEEAASTYDPNAFFRTPKVIKSQKPEKYLTFCTKDRAIRDSNNMIVACGAEGDVWSPPRCPTGTECFYTHDSTYRICCPVSRG